MTRAFFLILLLMTAAPAQAGTYFQGYYFSAHLESSSRRLPVRPLWNSSVQSVSVAEGDEYSIVVSNPLPVRVAALVTVDGLNTIDGEATVADRGPKWIVPAHGTIRIEGWQTGDSSQRKFVFTKSGYSYARWREEVDQRNYTHKLGQIKVAYFWNSRELNDALRWNRPYGLYGKRHRGYSSGVESSADSLLSAPSNFGGNAGTGMGRYEYNPVRAVHFNYDTGMFSEHEAIRIFYRFNGSCYRAGGFCDVPRPIPYPYHDPVRRYAPEMP